jgi:SRSO17 transposase
MRCHFVAIRIRPANRHIPRGHDSSLPEVWLIAEWPPDQPEPVKYWLSNMPARTRPSTMVQLGKLRWRIEHDSAS